MGFFLTESDRQKLKRLVDDAAVPGGFTLGRGNGKHHIPDIRICRPTTLDHLEASSGSTKSLAFDRWNTAATTDDEVVVVGATNFEVFDWLGHGISNSDTTGSTDLKAFAFRPVPNAKWYLFCPGFQKVEAELLSDLTTDTSAVTGTVRNSFGFGQFIPSGEVVTLKNMPTKMDNWNFSGLTSSVCYADWDHGKTFRIYQMECDDG